MRRRFALVFALVALLVTSGCTLPGADLTANAKAVSVGDGALAATGYTPSQHATIAINQTVGIDGSDHEVGVENRIRTYDSADGGHFVVFSTPNPKTDGAPVNRFANISERRDVARMLGEVNNTSALTVTDRRTVTMVGHSTQLMTYATTNRTAPGETTPVLVDIAVTQDDGDAVVAVGVRPRSAADATPRLIEGIDHGGST